MWVYHTAMSPPCLQDPVSPAGSASSYERPIKKERPSTPGSAKSSAPAVSTACVPSMVNVLMVCIRWEGWCVAYLLHKVRLAEMLC